MKKIWIIVSILPVILLAGCAGTTGSLDVSVKVQPTATVALSNRDADGKYVSDFTVKTTDGSFTLSKALRQYDYVFVNFWGSTCKPCKREMPLIQKMHEKYGDKIAFISLSAYSGDTMADAEKEKKEFGLTYPVGIDTVNLKSYRERSAVPYFMLIDKNMKVVWEFCGSRNDETLYTDMFSEFLK
ncbi:MAG: TlpA family protein disulfide reductase [Sphaerochaetaceae bacterium]|nr:TlpA family protein disulfide reductase [Sphaerochaetaceae bacterium]